MHFDLTAGTDERTPTGRQNFDLLQATQFTRIKKPSSNHADSSNFGKSERRALEVPNCLAPLVANNKNKHSPEHRHDNKARDICKCGVGAPTCKCKLAFVAWEGGPDRAAGPET